MTENRLHSLRVIQSLICDDETGLADSLLHQATEVVGKLTLNVM